MSTPACATCQKTKSLLNCGLCAEIVCKNCATFPDPETFARDPSPPAELAHSVYCPSCHSRVLDPGIENYRSMLEKARNVGIYFKHQGKETRLMKRTEKPVRVLDCADREETLLRLAFQAVKAGFSGLIDVDLVSTKVRDGAYQTSSWSATGIPSNLSKG